MNNADEVYEEWLKGGKTPEWMLFNDAIKDMKFVERKLISGDESSGNAV